MPGASVTNRNVKTRPRPVACRSSEFFTSALTAIERTEGTKCKVDFPDERNRLVKRWSTRGQNWTTIKIDPSVVRRWLEWVCIKGRRLACQVNWGVDTGKLNFKSTIDTAERDLAPTISTILNRWWSTQKTPNWTRWSTCTTSYSKSWNEKFKWADAKTTKSLFSSSRLALSVDESQQWPYSSRVASQWTNTTLNPNPKTPSRINRKNRADWNSHSIIIFSKSPIS